MSDHLISLDVTKYFGAEVGALTNWDEKEARYIVNGVHDADKLQTLLDGFIKKFVLCPKCDNPETELSVKNGIIFRTCKACGAKNPCDNLHKLATFIKTNPPPKPVKLKQAKDTAAANIRERIETEENIEGMVAPEGFADGLATAKVEVDEEDWDEDAAQFNRETELASMSERVKSSLAIKDDFQDPLEAFADIIEFKGADVTAELVCDEIKDRGIRSDKAVAVVTQVLLAGDVLKNLQTHSKIFESIVKSEKDQASFLGSVDRLLSSSDKTSAKQIPAILQASYMADIVDEEALNEWKDNPSKKFISRKDAEPIRMAAHPFFTWLEEDDDEEESDEE